MELKHISTAHQPDGVYEVEIVVINDDRRVKRYTYYLTSEWAVREFYKFYKRSKKLHGKALSILNQFKTKPPVDNTGKAHAQWHRNKG